MKETAQPQLVRKHGKAHHHGGTQILPPKHEGKT